MITYVPSGENLKAEFSLLSESCLALTFYVSLEKESELCFCGSFCMLFWEFTEVSSSVIFFFCACLNILLYGDVAVVINSVLFRCTRSAVGPGQVGFT